MKLTKIIVIVSIIMLIGTNFIFANPSAGKKINIDNINKQISNSKEMYLPSYTEPGITPKKISKSRMSFSRFISYSILVLGFVCVGLYFFKKQLHKRIIAQNLNKNINIIETYAFDPKKAIHLMKVGNKKILIGSTETQINYICDTE